MKRGGKNSFVFIYYLTSQQSLWNADQLQVKRGIDCEVKPLYKGIKGWVKLLILHSRLKSIPLVKGA